MTQKPDPIKTTIAQAVGWLPSHLPLTQASRGLSFQVHQGISTPLDLGVFQLWGRGTLKGHRGEGEPHPGAAWSLRLAQETCVHTED